MQNDRRDQKEPEKRKIMKNISQVHFNGHDREYN